MAIDDVPLSGILRRLRAPLAGRAAPVARVRKGFGPRNARRLATGIVPALSACGLLGCPGPALAWTEADIGPIAQVTLEAERAPRPVPGISAGVAFKDGTRWTGAAGHTAVTGTTPLAADDQMRIGSQTKTYTGTLVLELVDEHRIALDDTLAKWLPELRVPNDAAITVRDLLGMTSGIPDYLEGPSPAVPGDLVIDEWVAKHGRMTATPEALVAAADKLPASPIGVMSYSNTNFLLLGLIAEKAICGAPARPGCSYADALQHRVIDPVGLKRTVFPTSDAIPARHASGYARKVAGESFENAAATAAPDADAYVDFTAVDPSVPATAGAMISSAADEIAWSGQLAGNRFSLLSPAMQAQRLTAPLDGNVAGIPARYGLGIYFMRSLIDGTEMVGHAGSIYGYTSAVFRRTDNDTDYAANVATFSLTDQFFAPAVVWLLDRNITDALGAAGNCGADLPPGDAVCTGASVRQTGLALSGGSLALRPSGRADATYVPGAAAPTPVVAGRMPVPTVAVYGHGLTGVDLKGAAALTVDAGAALAMVGNGSSAVAVSGQGGTVEVDGAVTAAGFKVAAIRDGGTGTRLTIKGTVTGSVVWWDPDLRPSLSPSPYIVALPDDTSAALVLAGSGAPSAAVTIDGLVRTQRTGTAAVLIGPDSRDYRLVLGPTGRIVGPTVMEGDGASLDIATGGAALYAAESAIPLPPPPAAPAAAAAEAPALASGAAVQVVQPSRDAVLSALAGPGASRRPATGLGVPGMPPVSRDAVRANRLDGAVRRASAGAGTVFLALPDAGSPPPDLRVPPVVVSLDGHGDRLTVGGVVAGTLPNEVQTTYTANLAAVRVGGTGNSLVVSPPGVVVGDVVVTGRTATLRIDGTVLGNVSLADASASLTGTGQITGTLTIAGVVQRDYGTLKLSRPAP